MIDLLSINNSLEGPIVMNFPAAYRTDIDRNLLWLIEGRLVYYETILTITKHIYRIVVPTSLCRTIFNLMHANLLLGTWEIENYLPY